MKRGATDRQKELLGTIYDAIKDEGFPPSFDELRTRLGVASNQTILDHLDALEKKQLIKRIDKSARSILILPLGYKLLARPQLVPFLGSARAGAFTQNVELQGQWQQISDQVSEFKERMYIIKVAGDSMINANIEDGSTLLVQVAHQFVNGDIVVASTPAGVTVKRFVTQKVPPYMFLKPENPNHEIILFSDDMELQGKVIAKLEGELWWPFKRGNLS